MNGILHIKFGAAWSVVAKLAVIVSMFTTCALGILAPGSLTDIMADSILGDDLLFYIQATIGLFLVIDLLLTDHSSHGRREWKFQSFTPISYMLSGAVFLALSLVANPVPHSPILIMSYTCTAIVCGCIAFLEEIKFIRKKRGDDVC